MKIERSIVKRNADRPELAEGDRTLIELDPAQVQRMFEAGSEFVAELGRLLGRPPRRRRRR